MVQLIVSYYVCASEKVSFLCFSFFIFKRGRVLFVIFPCIIFSNSKATYHQRKSRQEFSLVKQAKDLFRLKFWRSVSDVTSIWRPQVSQFSSILFSHSVWLFATPWTGKHQASLSITHSQSLPKLMSIELEMPPNHLIFCCPLPLPPWIFPSIRV